MPKGRIWVALGAAGLLAAQAAQAQESGRPYIGAGLGQFMYEEDVPPFGSFDESDTAWKIFGGYRFNDYFAVEGGYADLGEPEDTLSGINVELDIDAFVVEAVGFVPLGQQFELFGKLGVASWDAKATASAGGVSASADDDGTDLAWGVGGKFGVAPNFDIRAEWEAVDIDGADQADFLSVGVQYNF